MGFYDASGLGAGDVWLDPDRSGRNLVWHYPWTIYIIADLVSSTNIEGKITKSKLELTILVLHEGTLTHDHAALRIG